MHLLGGMSVSLQIEIDLHEDGLMILDFKDDAEDDVDEFV